jgi:FAD/FMN-containing dehydrogenase
MKSSFDEAGINRDADVLSAYARDVSGLVGAPEGVVRPRDVETLQEFLRWASSNCCPVLPVGAQTSTTGASVAESGLIVDLQQMNEAPRIDQEARTVRVSASTKLGELQRLLWAEGLDLPPDPTSAMECTVGGAVATNASGPSTFKYGPISNFVRGLSFVDGRGQLRRVQSPLVEKSAMGPVGLQNPLGWFAGSEGLLGVIVDIEFDLVERAACSGAVFVRFEEDVLLFEGVSLLRNCALERSIRAIEWLDGRACDLIRAKAGRLKIPDGKTGGLYIEVEGDGLEAMELNLLAVVEALEQFGVCAEDAQVLSGRSALEDFAALRHEVPDKMNRLGRSASDDAGGGKLSTDWSVPIQELDSLLQWSEPRLRGAGAVDVVRYGHIGNGHPHLNVLCPDSESKVAVTKVLGEQLVRVVEVGGVPTSEHGIGKIKRDLVSAHLPPGFREALLGLKEHFDPMGILSKGNIVTNT